MAFRDRDMIEDVSGRLYVVLGYIQPPSRVLSFLKYIPSRQGKWAAGDKHYDRVFWGKVDDVTSGIETSMNEYVVMDPHFNTDLLEVPKEDIRTHFIPELRLKEIRERGPTDRLESQALGLADALHDTVGLAYSDMGVAGSILWKGHNPDFSDINMNVYGFKNSWILKEHLSSIGRADKVRLRQSEEWGRAKKRVLERTPALTLQDIGRLFERRYAFYYETQCIGVTPILRPDEVPVTYASESYHTISKIPVTTTFKVDDARFGLFAPSIIHGTSSPLDAFGGIRASRIMIYEGVYSGLIEDGDTIEVIGTLQIVKAKDRDADDFYQIMVGTKDGAGKELVRLVD